MSTVTSKEKKVFLFTALAGAVIWIFITIVSGRREAWDSEIFFIVGLPAMMLGAAVAGYIEPSKPWLWGIAVVCLQPIIMAIMNNDFSLLVLGLIVFGFFAALCIGASYIGAVIGKRLRTT